MAWQFALQKISAAGNFPTTSAFLLLKALLVANGWTIVASGSGTGGAYSANSDIVTTVAAFSTNTKPWFRMRAPAGGREWTVQQAGTSGSEGSYRIKYSAAAGFVGGAPAANVTPSATDEVILIGGGTDAAPTYGSAGINNATASAHLFAIVGQAPEGYSFYMGGWSAAPVGVTFNWYCDALQPGSYPVADADPTVHIATNGGALFPGYAWKRYGLSGAAFGLLTELSPFSTIGANPYSTGDDLFPLLYESNGGGWKGISTMFSRTSVAGRAFLSTFTVASAMDHLMVDGGSHIAPWNGTPPDIT